MTRSALIYNPTAGRQRHAQVLDPILEALRKGGLDVEPVPTGGPGQATGLARDRAAAGADLVIAFGGDGTVREVSAGILGTDAVLGILPGGTTNVLAMSLGLPLDPLESARFLPRLCPQPLDVGLVNEAPFLMMISAGLDSSVLAALDTRLKWRFGKAAIVWQGLQEWWRYPYPRFQVLADGEPFDASFVAVSNIPHYGGAYALAPGARPYDGRLDLVLFRGGGRLETIGFVADLLRGVHIRRKDVTIRHVREVVFESPSGAIAQIDGDVCEERLPLTVRIAPEPLRVMAPEIPSS
ncbi:MAG: diacylglycerol kinase family protein [Acidobacteriota bacterium]